MIILQVKKRSDGAKYIFVPRNLELNQGDYVQLIKVVDQEKWQKKKKLRNEQ